MTTVTLGRRFLAALQPVETATLFFDEAMPGFGLRASPATPKNPAGSLSWIAQYRVGEGGRKASKRRITIGPVALIAPEDARKRAAAILAGAKLGDDAAVAKQEARKAETLAELVPLYLAATNPTRKPASRVGYETYFRKHITPRLGKQRARDVTPIAVRRMHSEIGVKHQVTANRCVTVLAHFYRWAVESGYVAASPVGKIKKFREEGRERYLTDEELGRLGAAIREAETDGIPWAPSTAKHAPKSPEKTRTILSPFAAGALRLLLFTGARLREILHLRWCDVDNERALLFLADSKTGRKTIVLSGPAMAVIDDMRALADKLDGENVKRLPGPDMRFVIRSNQPQKPRADLKAPWDLVRERAGLGTVRLHDLRHTFASKGAGGGMGLPIVGALLGHKSTSTTARYAHLDSTPLRRATNTIAGGIADALAAPVADNVKPFERVRA
jgi:integrase